jgi:hypothetical protein
MSGKMKKLSPKEKKIYLRKGTKTLNRYMNKNRDRERK